MTPSGQKQILVAEDTDGDFFMFRQAFARAGFTHVLQRVKDGLELLAYLTGQPPYGNRSKWPFPDLLILDLLLPKLNGVDSLIYLKKELRLELPVVVLSASSTIPEGRKAVELGADDFFAKPITFKEMTELARKIHNMWLSDFRREEDS